MRLRQTGGLFRLAGILAICWFGAAARADDPLVLPPLAPKGPAATGDNNAPPPPIYPPWAQSDTVAADLTQRHRVYVQKLGPPTGYEGDAPTEPAFRVFAEGGFWMVKTHIDNNPALLVARGQGAAASLDIPHFDYREGFGPRVTLGAVTADGLGFRTSWWRMDDGARTPVTPGGDAAGRVTIASAPVAGLLGFTSAGPVARRTGVFNDRVGTNDHLQVQVLDWEAFRDFRRDCWSFLVGGGIRYGYLSQGYQAFRSNTGSAKSGATTFNVLQDADGVLTGRNFAGVGPTGVIELRRRFGDTGLALYGSVRGSVLFGREGTQAVQETASRVQTVVGGKTQTSTSASVVQAPSRGNETMPLADFELGAEYTLPYGHAVFLGRVGLVSANWFGAGSATSADGDVNFFGLRVTAGVSY